MHNRALFLPFFVHNSSWVRFFVDPICETRCVNRVRVLRYTLYNTNSTRIDGDCCVREAFHSLLKRFDEIVLKIEMLTKWGALAARRCFCRLCERYNGVHGGTLGGQWSVDGFRDPARALWLPVPFAPHETRYRRRLSSYYALKN